jgi:hypothetical protein
MERMILTAEAALGGAANRSHDPSIRQSSEGVVPQGCGIFDVIKCAGTLAGCAAAIAAGPAAAIACVTAAAPGCLKCLDL